MIDIDCKASFAAALGKANEMIKIPVNRHKMVYFDVDGTLILYDRDESTKGLITLGGLKLLPHIGHIKEIKKYKAKGWTVAVWSLNGSDWAELVIDTLGLREFVDVCISKPNIYHDDYPASEFMSEGILRFIKP